MKAHGFTLRVNPRPGKTHIYYKNGQWWQRGPRTNAVDGWLAHLFVTRLNRQKSD